MNSDEANYYIELLKSLTIWSLQEWIGFIAVSK
jgi:hypothetical protein